MSYIENPAEGEGMIRQNYRVEGGTSVTIEVSNDFRALTADEMARLVVFRDAVDQYATGAEPLWVEVARCCTTHGQVFIGPQCPEHASGCEIVPLFMKRSVEG